MFKVLTKGCEPERGSKYSACVDLFASEDMVIGAGETKLVGLGVCVDFQETDNDFVDYNSSNVVMPLWQFKKSHYLQLMLRSSLGKKGLILPNGVGVIDLDYEDEIKMIIHNPIITTFESDLKHQVFEIKKGDKIGQITLIEHKSCLFGIDTDVERNGGFGSTDKGDGKNV